MTKTAKTGRPAAIYVRISQDRGGASLGVERQEQECRALAKRLRWKVAEVYCDNDLSAFSGRRRPDYERMLADIEAGKITAVIAWHPDRLHRRAAELERYISLCDRHHVENQTVTAGMWDLSTPSGRMVARQLGAVAAYESEHKSERLKAARIQHSKQGRHHGGIRCYGYTGERHAKGPDGLAVAQQVIPEEAAEIANACNAIAGGASLRAVVRDMNARKVPTACGSVAGRPVLDKKTGQPKTDDKGHTRLQLGWTSQQLRQTLMSPRIAGHSTHKGIIVGTAAWPAIVDEDTWRTVEAILSNPARRTNHGVTGAAKWLGSGLYVCTCGQRAMRASVTGGSRRYNYRCANAADKSSQHVTRDAVALDGYVQRVLIERLSRPGTVEKLLHRDESADVAALRVEQVQLGERKDTAAAMFIDGKIDEVQLATITKRADERDKEIAEVLAKAGWRSPLEPLAGGNIEAAWEKLSLMQKRAILEVVADVHVLPTKASIKGFNPDGVRIDWKAG